MDERFDDSRENNQYINNDINTLIKTNIDLGMTSNHDGFNPNTNLRFKLLFKVRASFYVS